MTDAELEAAYSALLPTLRETGFEWVAAEVEAEVATGRLATVRLPAFTGAEQGFDPTSFHEPAVSRPGGRADFLRSEEYSPRDRFLMLVEAVRRCTVAAAQIHVEVLQLTKEILGAEAILVGDSNPDNDLLIASGQLDLNVVDRLSGLLNALNREALT